MDTQSDISEGILLFWDENKTVITDRIRTILESLETISSHSEEGFLTLGNAMQETYEQGTLVEGKINSILDHAQGRGGKILLGEIKEKIRDSLTILKNRRKYIETRSESVKETLTHLDKLKSKNSDIERLAKYLRAVALNIFIETSRSEALSRNFSIIATEIKELSENIIGLAKRVRDGLTESGEKFHMIYQGIIQGMVNMDGLTETANRSLAEAITQTDEWVEQIGTLANESAGLHKKILDEVGRIVMSLQFHDAMRQRLEHIESGLMEMVELTKAAGSDVEHIRETLSLQYAMASLFSDQMAQIIDEVDENRLVISTGFESIEDLIGQSEEQVQQLTGVSVGDGDVMLTGSDNRLIQSLSGFLSLKDRCKEQVEQINRAYTMVSETSTTLSDQVGLIHQISMDAHIKALNAIIAATHLGHEGKTLAVLAGEMKVLSDLTDTFVKDVGGILDQMLASTDSNETMDAKDEDACIALDTEVHTLSGTLDTISADSEEMVQVMDKTLAIHHRVVETITFIPSLVKDLRRQKEDLDAVREILFPHRGDQGLAAKIHERIQERYTMETERQVHRQHVEGDTAGVAIEQDGDEDDNIELF